MQENTNELFNDWNSRKNKRAKAHRKLLKRVGKLKPKQLNEEAEAMHEQVFSEIDCLDCANCCKSIPPMLSRTDIKRVAHHLNMKPTDFETKYIRIDNDGDKVMNASPCPFLQADNKCEIYEVRPRACRKYPHTDEFQFVEHQNLLPTNARHCPAVFHILERMIEKF